MMKRKKTLPNIQNMALTPKLQEIFSLCAMPVGLIKQKGSLKYMFGMKNAADTTKLDYHDVSVSESGLNKLLKKQLIVAKVLTQEGKPIATQYVLTDKGREIIKVMAGELARRAKAAVA
jgi:hypothetical protein